MVWPSIISMLASSSVCLLSSIGRTAPSYFPPRLYLPGSVLNNGFALRMEAIIDNANVSLQVDDNSNEYILI